MMDVSDRAWERWWKDNFRLKPIASTSTSISGGDGFGSSDSGSITVCKIKSSILSTTDDSIFSTTDDSFETLLLSSEPVAGFENENEEEEVWVKSS